MAVPPDPQLGGPLPPPDPRDPRSPGDLAPTERMEDPVRDEHGLTRTSDRALTDDEEEAAEHDPGRQPRTYAPHEERVPKPPAPGDREVVEEGLRGEGATGPGASAHPADRSAPEEMRP